MENFLLSSADGYAPLADPYTAVNFNLTQQLIFITITGKNLAVKIDDFTFFLS